MKWIGLTGGIASGKTTVSNLLKELSISIVDADQMAHQALKFHHDKIVSYFGPDILDDRNRIDRKKLGAKVFTNDKQRKILEGMVHPFVQEKVKEKKRLLAAVGKSWAVYDVPLLFEKKMEDQFDEVVVVYAPRDLCLQRLMDRNSFSQEEAEQRMATQIDIEEKKKKANSVILNTGDLSTLKEQVKAWKESIDEKYNSPSGE